jgi:hypothetical protein
MDTVPFKVHDPDAMLTETEGIMQVYEDGLLLQLETRDAIIGHFKSTAEVHIPLDEISSVDFRKRWYGTSLIIQVRNIEVLQQVHGSKLGQIRLKFRRRHRDAAENLAIVLQDSLYDLQLDWEEELDGRALEGGGNPERRARE